MLAADYQTERRMALKCEAVPLPDMAGKRVLDVGCDMGFWCRLASERGAADVLGLDRNRAVRGTMADLIAFNRAQEIPRTRFERIDLGKEWRTFGTFDIILCLSMYHHWFENCGDHQAIWFWLRRHLADDGVVIWEGPVDDSDPVVRANVGAANRAAFTRGRILDAARFFFVPESVGPALHEPTRQVWRFFPESAGSIAASARVVPGAGGATAAFNHAGGRRIDEIARVTGMRPFPGSLNVRMPFHWDFGYYRAEILDVADRRQGLDGEWRPRWARFYPLTVDGIAAFAFRFEGERYPDDFVEIVSDRRLRDAIDGDTVRICRSH